jgi:hypothetical protein
MEYTPRQLAAFLFIAERRRRDELREQLHISTLAARGDEKAIHGQLKEWAADG